MRFFNNIKPMLCIALIAVCLFFLSIQSKKASAQDWQPVDDQIMSRWAHDVSPDNVLPEYPRPLMVREQWINLNGLWDYTVIDRDAEKPDGFIGQILVPFPIESALSGVKKAVTPKQRLWYRRTFDVPKDWKGQRLLLHFDAVDWEATVWVNDKKVGSHKGGYDPFTFDITDALKESGPQEIIVSVWDSTDEGYQCNGKQRLNPRGFWYTAVTGIWQTVWVEPVNRDSGHIESLKIIPDLDSQIINVTVNPGGRRLNQKVQLKVKGSDILIAEATGNAGDKIGLKINDAKLWSPVSPFLYNLEVSLLHDGKEVDHVESYFGMRKISKIRDKMGTLRLALNNEIMFQYGPLDQGWWPDGLYRAPTDEALRYDVEMTKRLGFNMLRKHIKVEPQRFYYWCDVLGILVWQDMVSGDVTGEWGTDRSPESAAQFELELKNMLDAFHNHPSIVLWVLFNEGWGEFDVERLTALTKAKDPSRLVINASGFVDHGVGDIHGVHAYPGPTGAPFEEDRALVHGEFGGLSLSVKDHLWEREGRRGYKDSEALTVAYEELIEKLIPYVSNGISAAVYTQITDVENELNGLMTYDRAVLKIDTDKHIEIAQKLYDVKPGSFNFKPIMASSQKKPQEWKYTTENPGDNWNKSNFDDSKWAIGEGGFGDPEAVCPVVRTKWKEKDLWMRRTFDITGKDISNPYLIIYHDFEETIEVSINGEAIAEGPEHQFAYTLFPLKGKLNLKTGENLIAVHTTSNRRWYVDIGLLNLAD